MSHSTSSELVDKIISGGRESIEGPLSNSLPNNNQAMDPPELLPPPPSMEKVPVPSPSSLDSAFIKILHVAADSGSNPKWDTTTIVNDTPIRRLKNIPYSSADPMQKLDIYFPPNHPAGTKDTSEAGEERSDEQKVVICSTRLSPVITKRAPPFRSLLLN